MKLLTQHLRVCIRHLWICALLVLPIGAREYPESNGSCMVSATGVNACQWLSTPPSTKPGKRNKKNRLFVTQFVLQPGAPFRWSLTNRDAILVATSEVSLVNQDKSGADIRLTKNNVAFLQGARKYFLKNDGKESVSFLLIQLDKPFSSHK